MVRGSVSLDRHGSSLAQNGKNLKTSWLVPARPGWDRLQVDSQATVDRGFENGFPAKPTGIQMTWRYSSPREDVLGSFDREHPANRSERASPFSGLDIANSLFVILS